MVACKQQYYKQIFLSSPPPPPTPPGQISPLGGGVVFFSNEPILLKYKVADNKLKSSRKLNFLIYIVNDLENSKDTVLVRFWVEFPEHSKVGPKK